jgi:hypothetical protein
MQPLPTNILCGTNIIQETEPDNEDEDFNEDIRDVDESNHTLPEPMDHCSKLMSIPQNSIGIQVDFNMFSASEVTFGESQPSLHSSMMSQSSGASSTCHISRIDAIPATEACCFLCKSTTDRAVIPKPAIQQGWSELSIFVPRTNRCCKIHLNSKKRFSNEDLARIEATKYGMEISGAEFSRWLILITNSSSNSNIISFEEDGVDDSNYKMLTGLEKSYFDELYEDYLRGNLRNSCNRSVRDALGMFLMLLRGNISQKWLGYLFGTTQPVVSTTVRSVASVLTATFVPYNLGIDPINHITREDAQKHNIPFFNGMFKKPATSMGLICDGTYIYIEKPSDFELQRLTYSGHKYRNLLKVMIVCAPNGYILEAGGPYFANGGNNDSNIIDHMLETSDLELFLDEGDYWVLDRGFRDIKQKLEACGTDVFMPELLKKGEKTLSAEAAGKSRITTSCRYVVEQVNGRLKGVFKWFSQTVEGSYSPQTIIDFTKIACALLNKYFPPLLTPSPRHEEIVRRVLERAALGNELQDYIDANGLSSRQTSHWELASSDSCPDFPKLTMDDLLNFTLGIYQLRMAAWYTREHLDEDATYKIYLHKEEEGLLRVKMHSRYRSAEYHQVWIRIDTTKGGIDAVPGYTCDCRVGKRVVGACSHVTAVRSGFNLYIYCAVFYFVFY